MFDRTLSSMCYCSVWQLSARAGVGMGRDVEAFVLEHRDGTVVRFDVLQIKVYDAVATGGLT